MVKLELIVEEMKVLEEVLRGGINDLEEEVGHTDSHDFKERLKHKKAVLERLAGKVSAEVPA